MNFPKVLFKSKLRVLFFFLLAAIAYGVAIHMLRAAPRPRLQPELLVSLPRFAQVLMAGGDRHLAANLSGFRVLVASTERMRAEDFSVQAKLQKDIAWLNPAHEDNYYIAAAILPWNGHVAVAQDVLRSAGSRRTFDWQPLFYLGFGYYHFMNDPASGAAQLLEGAKRATDQQDEWALQNLAARWLERGYDSKTALGLVQAMADSAPAGAFQKYLQVRAARLAMLVSLQDAAKIYKQRQGESPGSLNDLLVAGLVKELPVDPLGSGFVLDAAGWPVFKPAQ